MVYKIPVCAHVKIQHYEKSTAEATALMNSCKRKILRPCGHIGGPSIDCQCISNITSSPSMDVELKIF